MLKLVKSDGLNLFISETSLIKEKMINPFKFKGI